MVKINAPATDTATTRQQTFVLISGFLGAGKELVDQIAMPADSFARMVAFAVIQPEDVDVNEILFRSTRQPL
jgi:NADP-dependent 3-hydroxy acid dehydrogenase YdfG